MMIYLLTLNLLWIHPQIFPPSWHLLHLHLDIHWSVLEILHLLSRKMQGICLVLAPQFANRNFELNMLKLLNGTCVCYSYSLSLKQAFSYCNVSLQARWCTPTSL